MISLKLNDCENCSFVKDEIQVKQTSPFIIYNIVLENIFPFQFSEVDVPINHTFTPYEIL